MANEGKVVVVQGRIVWTCGKNVFEANKITEFGTTKPKLDKNGEQQEQYGFGLAIGKADLADPNKAGEFWATLHQEAHAVYPTGQIPPQFAWKYKDGDGIDDKGRPFNQREGYSGHLVFAMTTFQTIRFFRWEGGQNIQVADGIKCGDYVRVQVRVVGHGAIGQGKPGLYLNPLNVQLVAPGKEIINMPTGDDVFGNAAPQAPPNYIPPEQPVMPTVAAPATIMAPPAPGMPMPAPTAPQPHHAVLPPTHQPPVGSYPAQPAVSTPMAPVPMQTVPAPMPGSPMMPPIPGVPR